ncbi:MULTISPECIES: acyl carrier protein [unclassified Streptomyces]|uniref:acyl carrier protein n=1 Tax=unclassified Streptomyces TaxID=2593676 RepID=UPI00081B64B7|nr:MULTISPECIES: acyl carrier protein [unclassified Streptomyces]MYQ82539.1 acyl carrier protein [Streptomyces sp. SID4936]SCD43629.1 Acyl carrier protein [Streptomyces sp. DvalAA-43]
MADSLHAGGRPSGLSGAERREALEELVVTQFKEALLMGADEELELDTSFFDLGLTSLRLNVLRQQLEKRLGTAIDATALFNQPTDGQLVDHLTESTDQDKDRRHTDAV